MITTLAASAYGKALAYRLYHPPRRRHHRTPEQFGLQAREETVRTTDGVDLHVWVVPGHSDRVAVIGHGIGLTKSGSLPHAALLADAGFNILMFDHRNHGRSGRDRSARHLSDRFTKDVEACVNAAQEFFPDSSSTVVWGFSFSSFPSFFVLGRGNCRVDAVMCDSGPADELEPLFGHFVEAGALPIPGPFRGAKAKEALIRSCAATATRMLDADWPPPAELGHFSSTPMLFLSGREDTITRPAAVRALADRYPGAHAEVIEGSHLDGIKVDPEGYGRHVKDFLASAL